MEKEPLWTKGYVLDILINFLVYTVHFALMLWAAGMALVRWQVSVSAAGLASGIFIVGALLARLPAGRYIDWAGRRWMLLSGAGAFFLFLVSYLAADGFAVFLAVRFLHGVAFGVLSTAASTCAAALIPVKRMGSGIGYYTLGVTLASAAGPFIAMHCINAGAYEWVLYLSIGLAGVILGLSLWLCVPERRPSASERKELRRFAPDAFFAKPALPIAFVALLGGVCYSTVLSFLGAYASALGLSSVGGAYFFLCFAATSFVSRPLTGWMLDRYGGDAVVAPSLVLLVVSMLTIAEAGSDWQLLAGGFLLGAGYGTLTAACHALAVRSAGKAQLGVATSTYFVLLDLGIGVGPYFLGGLVSAYGFSMVYLAAAVIALFGMYFYYGRRLTFGRKSFRV